MITVLVPPGVSAGRRERLEDSEQHHLRVRRAGDGERVALRDGAGLVGQGRLVAARSGWEVEVEAAEHAPRPPELTLAVGAGDRDRLAWLVEKSVELGATAVVPLETGHTRGVASRLRTEHVEKLQRQALETLKQCGAAWAPTVESLAGIDEFLTRQPSGHRWLADAEGGPPPAGLDASPVTVVVGPEGGLTADERAAVLAARYDPVRLGPYILRFETAALAAATAVTTARLRGSHG